MKMNLLTDTLARPFRRAAWPDTARGLAVEVADLRRQLAHRTELCRALERHFRRALDDRDAARAERDRLRTEVRDHLADLSPLLPEDGDTVTRSAP